ncbi:MAG: hypothetical protein HY243_11260 [Proteobacteria bacterium]|nr:hypothetical protein [Pseudomonadota bacterium]
MRSIVEYSGEAGCDTSLAILGVPSTLKPDSLCLGADFSDDPQATLFVDNVWDKRAPLAISTRDLCTSIPCAAFNPAVPAQLRAVIAQPRTIRLTLSKKF